MTIKRLQWLIKDKYNKFVRWYNKPSKRLMEIGYEINSYYTQKHTVDGVCNYAKAQEDVRNCCITNLELKLGKLVVHTRRPGLFIGRKGENIEGLSKFLNIPIHIEEVKFSWEDIITPLDWSDDY